MREDEEALDHLLSVLDEAGATYRFGAPLDLRWMRRGWSSHFEFAHEGIRVRTDFFTRPPRLDRIELERLWLDQEGRTPPFTGLVELAKLKMTQREKDYPVIGELARLMESPADQLRFSRSAYDLCRLCRDPPELAAELAEERSLLALATEPDADPERDRRLAAERSPCDRVRNGPAISPRPITPITPITVTCRGQFLSEEDLDLKNLEWDELIAAWNAWLRQASASDETDAGDYSHGVFGGIQEPGRRGRDVDVPSL